MWLVNLKWTCKIWFAHDTAREARIDTPSKVKEGIRRDFWLVFLAIKWSLFAPCTSMTALQKACGGSLVKLQSQLFRKHRSEKHRAMFKIAIISQRSILSCQVRTYNLLQWQIYKSVYHSNKRRINIVI